jgi:2-polyprenyl-3-methyl-5-hydroxy-6-metoxy-1,4-benzoquinol methylase
MKITICRVCFSKSIEKYLVNSGYQFMVCHNCGLIFVSNIPDKKIINRIYEHFKYNDLNLDEINIRNDAKKSLEVINNHLPTSNLLDIGCGNGYLLDEAIKLGWNAKGIDYSDKTVNYAVSKLCLDVKKENILQYKNISKYNLLTLNQVIEHFTNPTQLIKKCYSLLNKNGYIYIATPNIDSFLSKVTKDKFVYLIPPLHLTYFNDKSMKILLKKQGFRIVYSGTRSYPVDLASVIKNLFLHNTVLQTKTSKATVPSNNKITVVKKIKYLLFDIIFCRTFYRLLNYNKGGSILEIIAQKL